METVTQVQSVKGGGSEGGGDHDHADGSESHGWDTAIGKLHPLLVHFPIAWLFFLVLVDLRTVAWRRPGWERLGLILLTLTVLAAAAAAATGLLRADHLPPGHGTEEMVRDHRNLALATGSVLVVALGLRLARRNSLDGAWRWVYLGLLGLALGLVVVTGYNGGHLVWGKDYLPLP